MSWSPPCPHTAIPVSASNGREITVSRFGALHTQSCVVAGLGHCSLFPVVVMPVASGALQGLSSSYERVTGSCVERAREREGHREAAGSSASGRGFSLLQFQGLNQPGKNAPGQHKTRTGCRNSAELGNWTLGPFTECRWGQAGLEASGLATGVTSMPPG